MSTALLTPVRDHTDRGGALAAGMIVLAIGAAVLAGAIPIEFSIATVFLFAGPHNWMEARYMLGRLPARTGKLTGFFTFSFVGILGLAAMFALLPSYLRAYDSHPEDYATAYALWNTLTILWIATLIAMRGHTNPRFDAGWVWPLAFLLIAGNWLQPFLVSMSLVYLHPLMALWILDRELRRSRPHWRGAYHACLISLPLLAFVLWFTLHGAPALPGSDPVTLAISNHAGDWFFAGISNHFLIALHTFLEMVHYGIWILIIPLLGYRSAPWNLHTIPAARVSRNWQRGVAMLLLAGLFLVVVLWSCFLIDYGTTRYIYFVVALVHVLTEVPFLLRMI